MKEITLGGTPVIITTESEGLLTPVKGRGLTVEIVDENYLYDLYTKKPKDSPVLVFDEDGNTIIRGYVTPNIYSQDVNMLNTIQIECTDALSVLQYYDFRNNEELSATTSFYNILKYMLHDICGYNKMYFSRDLLIPGDAEPNPSEALKHIYINEGNFQDDDGSWEITDGITTYKSDRSKCNEVLEEICKFLNVSITVWRDNVYMINYFALNNSPQLITDRDARYFRVYDFTTDTVTTESPTSEIALTSANWKDGTPSISLAPVYSKITVKNNTYAANSDSIIRDINKDDDKVTIGVYPWDEASSLVKYDEFALAHYGDTGDDKRYYYVMPLKNRFWNQYEYLYKMDDKMVFDTIDHGNGYYYNLEYKLSKSSLHNLQGRENANFYIGKGQATYNKYGFGSDGDIIHSIYYREQEDFGGMLYKLFNYSTYKTLPAKANWQNYICLGTGLPMYINEENYNWLMTSDILDAKDYRNAPFFEYKSSQTNIFSRNERTTWILINGNLRYEDFWWCPLTDIDTEYTEEKILYRTRLNCCFKGLQMKIKIGDKFWHQEYSATTGDDEDLILNRGYWSTGETSFYVPIACEDDGENVFAFNKQMSIFNTVDFWENVGEEGYAIPIQPTDNLAGQIEIQVLVPHLYINKDDTYRAEDAYRHATGDTMYRTGRWVTLSDFKIKFISQEYDWLEVGKQNSDIEFFNISDEQYTEELSAIELKINTQDQNAENSLSSVLTNGGNSFLTNTESHSLNSRQLQEQNIIEQQYEHYSTPKIQMNATLKGEHKPTNIYTYQVLDRDYKMFLDSYEHDIKNNKTEVTLEEF